MSDKVCVLLRPEDLRVYDCAKDTTDNTLQDSVDRTYRGATLDSLIELDSGKILRASGFDEDDPDFDYRLGQSVAKLGR